MYKFFFDKVSARKITKEVNFVGLETKNNTINDKIDSEYRSKHQKYGNMYVNPMISSQVRETTLKLLPS